MNLAGIVIILIFLVLVIIGILIIGVYNKLTFYKNRVLDKFSSINDCLNERVVIIKNIIDIINSDLFHEDSLVMELNKLIMEINRENVVNNLLVLIDKSDNILKKALALDSFYDSLKDNKDYIRLVEKFKDNQYKIMYAIEIYNEEALVYNNYKMKNGINIVGKLFKLVDYNYYKK